MGSHIDSTNLNTNSASSLHDAANSGRSTTSNIMQKINDGLMCRMGEVTWRNDDCSKYYIKFGQDLVMYTAVLAFDKKFYAITGMPKMGDTVVAVQSDGNNAYILFVANNKDKEDPPYGGSASQIDISIAPSISMLG